MMNDAGLSSLTRRGTLVRPDVRARADGSVGQQIAMQILSGELPPGYVFPTEVEFAASIGISRSALREAFRGLSAKGLVESRPKAGTRVTPRRRWSLLDPDVLAWQFSAEPSEKVIVDLFELRMMVEPTAAALAATRRTAADVEAMRVSLEEMAARGLADPRGQLADQHFHMTMLEATGNDMIIALASSIMAAIAWTTIYKQRKRALPRDPIPEHRTLFETIAAQDPAAASAAMSELIRLALRDTEVSLREETAAVIHRS